MDDDDYRRGRLTNHKKFGEAMAILAGDALFLDPCLEIAHRFAPSQIKVDLIANLSLASESGYGGRASFGYGGRTPALVFGRTLDYSCQ